MVSSLEVGGAADLQVAEDMESMRDRRGRVVCDCENRGLINKSPDSR